MCDFRIPFFKDTGEEVPYDCNVDKLSPYRTMKAGFSYSIGHTGSFTFYYDGKLTYRPENDCPEIIWKTHNCFKDFDFEKEENNATK